MASTRHVILLTLTTFMSVVIANAARLPPNYKEPSGAIDDLVLKAVNSSNYFSLDDDNRFVLAEGDMLLTQHQWLKMYYPHRQRRGAAINEDQLKRWTDNTVNYEIKSGAFPQDVVAIIKASMADWEGYTCVKFKSSDTAVNRIVLKDEKRCSSHVGMLGGTQTVSLGDGCEFKNKILHELGHALGLQHEQTRPDRDDYITVHLENIMDDMEYNFKKYKWGYIQNLGVSYDYNSIMHYSQYHFANGKGPSITTKDDRFQEVIGTSKELSFGDIKSMNLMYKCNAACGVRKTPCPFNGFVGKDCRCWCPATGTTARYCFAMDRERLGPIVREGLTKCEDNHPDCEAWKKDGRCSRYPDYVPLRCPLTCNACEE